MATDEYVKAFDKALADLEQKIQQRDLLNAEIAGLKETVRVLSSRGSISIDRRQRVAQLIAMLDYATPNLTDAIRSLLTRIFPKDMTAIEVRNYLEKTGFDFDDFSNPLSACHTTLKRMITDGEAEPGEVREGKQSYKRILPEPGLNYLEMLANPTFRPDSGLHQALLQTRPLSDLGTTDAPKRKTLGQRIAETGKKTEYIKPPEPPKFYGK